MTRVEQIAKTLIRWIYSCRTYEQLITCERAVEALLIEPYRFCTELPDHSWRVATALQMQRIELQLMPLPMRYQVEAALHLGRRCFVFRAPY